MFGLIARIKDQGSRIGWSIENALDLKKSPFSVYSGPIIMALEYQGECPGKVAKKNEKLRAALPLGTHCIEREARQCDVESHNSQTYESVGINEPHKPHVFENKHTFCVVYAGNFFPLIGRKLHRLQPKRKRRQQGSTWVQKLDLPMIMGFIK